MDAGPNTSSSEHALCPAPTTFAHAVCATGDFAHVGAIKILAGGALGVNGHTELVADAQVDGSFDAYGGLSAVGAAVGGSLTSAANVSLAGEFSIDGDANIGGDLTGIGRMILGGTLGLAGTESLLGDMSIGARGAYAAPSLPCDANAAFDVAGAVAAAAASAPSSSWSNVGAKDVHLPTGTYYVTAADIVGTSKIIVEGKASVFVDGSLRNVGAQQFELAAGGELDLFVSGSVQSVGDLVAGDASRADAFRLWVGANGALQIVGSGQFYGSIYAPEAAVQHVGDLRVVGSMFAKTYEGVGTLTVEYQTPGSQPTSCEPENPENPVSGQPIVY